jgi:hypothetical protein
MTASAERRLRRGDIHRTGRRGRRSARVCDGDGILVRSDGGIGVEGVGVNEIASPYLPGLIGHGELELAEKDRTSFPRVPDAAGSFGLVTTRSARSARSGRRSR